MFRPVVKCKDHFKFVLINGIEQDKIHSLQGFVFLRIINCV